VRAARAADATVVTASSEGQPIDTLRAALHGIGEEVEAVVVLPVDCPFVRAETVRRLMAALRDDDVDAVVPVFEGAPGHPVVLRRTLFADVENGAWPEGLRSLLAARLGRALHLAVDDAGVMGDLDTPEEARRHGVDV
jgi:molybdenum cofactor cytidylyltransferase